MSKNLIHSNPYLKDSRKLKKSLEKNVSSSSAVEGIFVTRDVKTEQFVQKKSSSNAPKAIRVATKSP